MKLIIIIPCYNEELRLNIDSFIKFGSDHQHINFLFVNDGSTDNTTFVIQQICDKLKNSSLIVLDKNKGKAEAIRTAVLSFKNQVSEYDFIGYMDADLSVKLEELSNFIKIINERSEIKFIMGSRVNLLGSDIKRTLKRHYTGRLFATVFSILFKKNIYDTQCGLKLIESSLITQLFKDKFISKWLFDIELIIRWDIIFPEYKNMIIEHPLKSWHDISGSKLKLTNFIYAPFQLFLIWKKYRNFIK
ncbi:glycosyltransferase [Mariniflexile sp. AS56]|uniref:glycosyltransferase n=1 Tax=Mariniflexile sp. AS56 TaxID=3063957 RepID=UPI0026F201D6|nr:glycosyltransferase [Mariniflexile sp. AS56]MDO7172752.1 glycosyltransferase [Mariniflexile sp. AS56]